MAKTWYNVDPKVRRVNYVKAAHAIPGASKEDAEHDMDIMKDENF